jgi:hypothetical protein
MASQKATKLSLALYATLLSVTLQCHAETASDTSIKELFTASGQEAQMVEGIQLILPTLRQLAKDMPDDLFRELTRTDTIVAPIIPIYRKYFTEEDIREIIAFYKTPVGSKYAKLAGKIHREGMEMSAKQGQMTVINYQIQKGKFTVEPPKE